MSLDSKDKKDLSELVDHLFRNEYGKMVSYLTQSFGYHFIDDAEDIAQETLLTAYNNWSYKGVPNNPEGWMIRVARNKALNVLKGSKVKLKFAQKEGENKLVEADNIYPDQEIQDSMLRMIVACCNPLISTKSQVTLVLSVLCGFSKKEIANALLDDEETIKKRLYRSKKQLRENNLSIDELEGRDLESRLNTVYSCLYLLFNEGYNSSHHDNLIRKDLCLEAMRLAKLLVQRYQNESTAKALLALMCFHVARFDGRIDDKGAIVLFKDQDRGIWNRDLIQMGSYYLTGATSKEGLNAYHVEASIAAIHCHASSYDKTNWSFIGQLYHQLYNLKPSPIILLNIAIVESQLNGIDSGIEQISRLIEKEPQLKNYYLLYATLGEFYSQTGNKDLSVSNFKKAKSLTFSPKEQELLQRKIEALNATPH